MNLGFNVQTRQHFIKKRNKHFGGYLLFSLPSAGSSGGTTPFPELTCLLLLNQQGGIALRGFGQGVSQLKEQKNSQWEYLIKS